MDTQGPGETVSQENIDIDTPMGRVAIDLDGKPKDDKFVWLFVHLKKAPKLIKAMMPEDGRFKVLVARSVIRGYGEKLIALAERMS